MTLQQRVLAYLRSIAPHRATNGDIRHNLGVRHHPQIYQETQLLLQRGRICGQRDGNEWVFWVETASSDSSVPILVERHDNLPVQELPTMDSRRFEILAQEVMSHHFGVPLRKGSVPCVHKQFDLVSADGQIVGDAKYFSLVRGERLPPAKFSIIAEHVWLLEKTDACHRFLVFGNDPRVPGQWLVRYGELVDSVDFYFLRNDGQLRQLTDG